MGAFVAANIQGLRDQQQIPQPTPQDNGGTTVLPQTAGYGSDLANPSAMPIQGPTPGSVQDLEARATQLRQPQAQQQQQPGTWSENNPFAKIATDYQTQWQQSQPKPDRGGAVKKLLTNFFSGMGSSMMAASGQMTPEMQRQQLQTNMLHAATLAQGWESAQSENRYRNTLAENAEQQGNFNAALQPGRVVQQQQELAQGQQNIPTVPVIYTAEHIKSLFPMMADDTVQQYAGHPLNAADQAALQQKEALFERVHGLEKLDYGADGTGQGKGIWWINSITKQPKSQISPISETSRSTALARQGMQMQLLQTQSGQTGIDIVEGRMDPSQISPRSPQYPYVLNAANQYSMAQYGQPFDFAKATSDYGYAKNTQTQNTLKMINAMTDRGGSIDIAQNAARNLPQFNSTLLNQVFNATATQFGSAEASNFHTAMLGLADEYSKVMGGGVSSDTGRQQSLDLLKAAYSKNQLAGAVDIMRRDITARKSALIGNNTYLQRQYSPRAAGAASVMQPTGAAGFDWNAMPEHR